MSRAPNILLDVSRLLLRAGQSAPTGIDRVELAYAEYLIKHEPDRLSFAAIHPLGRLAVLPMAPVRRFVQGIARYWSAPIGEGWALHLKASQLMHGILMRPCIQPPPRGTYLNVSHHKLNRPGAIERLKQRGIRFVCLVHDLIPMQLPEYVRPSSAERHRRRIDTVARLSDGIICNSNATRDVLMPILLKENRFPSVVVARLGVSGEPAVPPLEQTDKHPYFVCLGTIEPRKNHVLLLNIWRRLAESAGTAPPPRLLLVGRRGWENQSTLSMIDRCSALVGHVQELAGVPDVMVRQLLAGARALLFPSFAEGFGLPIAEALALGVPVLCSNLPVFREVGATVPEYIDPLDGVGWAAAITDYAMPGSPRRAEQIRRIQAWHPPSWDRHMQQAIEMIDGGTSPDVRCD